MEMIQIEASTFEAMMRRFDEFTKSVIKLCESKSERRLEKWLDNREVCTILNISKRTLQTYRDNGTLPFSRIDNHIYYRPSDVERLIGKKYLKPIK